MIDAIARDVIDNHPANLQLIESLESMLKVVREDSGLQAVSRIIHRLERLVKIPERKDINYRRKNLAAAHFAFMLHIRQDGWQEEIALPPAASDNRRAFVHRLLHPLLSAIQRLLIDHRANIGGLIQRIAQLQRLGMGLEFGKKWLGNRLMHIDPLDRDTGLPGIREAH